MPQTMNWTQLRKILAEQDRERLVEIIKGLYRLSPKNKAYLHTQFGESHQDPAFLEACRKRIIKAIYPPGTYNISTPKFVQARKAVNDYKKATGDLRGTIDLELTIVEQGVELCSDYGCFEPVYFERLFTALNNAVEMILSSPTRIQLNAHFKPRLDRLEMQSTSSDFGFGDVVFETVIQLDDL